MTFDLADFQDTENRTRYQHSYDNITLADRSFVVPNGIDIVILKFHINSHIKNILMSSVCYYSKL